MTKIRPKIFILVTDGVSLRNFAYSNFCRQLEVQGYDVWFWHSTPFDIKLFGFKEVTLNSPKLNALTTCVKNAKKIIELTQFQIRFKESVFKSYLFPLEDKGITSFVKNRITKLLIKFCNSTTGLTKVRQWIRTLEKKTAYYKRCKATLETHMPDLIYNTSQRSVFSIAPTEAAKNLNIPTVGFVYSWDNLPKATLDVETDYFHVWSDYMKTELLNYYPFVKAHQVTVTGTPQFEPHFYKDNQYDKLKFYTKYNLDFQTNYICFSGDDITTSPHDQLYLRDVAKAVTTLNKNGYKLGIIFRRCPVDFSDRYDSILEEYKDIICAIEPLWENKQGVWNTILPLPEDHLLLRSIAKHCAAVINLGSSMVFDFAIHNKPCLYMNYSYNRYQETISPGVHVYQYMHFKSKPSNGVVGWLNHPDTIGNQIKQVLAQPKPIVNEAKAWFQIINEHPADMASKRIIKHLSLLVQK